MDGELEKLLSYELRPEIKSFRSDENTRSKFLDYFGKVFEKLGVLNLSSNYKKILNIEKSDQVLGIINLNIDGLLKINGAQKLIELEGNVNWFYCSECGMDKESSLIIENEDEYVCNSCGQNILKPSIPFIGQEFSQWDLRDSWMMLNGCENLIIFADNFLSPVTISFIDIIERRTKNTIIACSSSMESDFSFERINFIYDKNEAYLDSINDMLGDNLV